MPPSGAALRSSCRCGNSQRSAGCRTGCAGGTCAYCGGSVVTISREGWRWIASRLVMDDPCFASAPTMGKVAVGGRWEEALVFQPSPVGPAGLVEHLGTSEEVACEAFFGAAFFGMRVHGPAPARF